MNAPVEKLTDPRFPWMLPYLTKVEPDSVRPLALPESVPPTLVMSMLLAKAANGRASARTASNTSFLTMKLLPPRKVPIVGLRGKETFFE
jgi:hypothetical protein